MSVFVTGDTHGSYDIKKVYNWYNKNVSSLTKEDVLIQLGDWGAIWYNRHDIHKYRKDTELQLKWAKKNFTLLVVDGNHENHDIIDKLPREEMFGGYVKILTPVNHFNQKKDYGSIFILERGEVYTINGKKFLALGGAMSQDKVHRVLGESIWEQELWNKEQEDNCLDNLEKHYWEVDYVVGHTCPESIGRIILDGERIAMSNDKYFSAKSKVNDPTSKFFQHLIDEGLKFKTWHFGHWHEDREFFQYVREEHGEMYYKYQCHYFKQPLQVI